MYSGTTVLFFFIMGVVFGVLVNKICKNMDDFDE